MGEQSPEPASTPTGAVFLSYASQDADAAKRICDALRAAGIEVWFDQSELRGGDAWDRRIREQIHDCRLFIAVGHVANTFDRQPPFPTESSPRLAFQSGPRHQDKAFVVPVAIDGTSERTARVPDPFKHVQWMRLPGGEAPPAFVEELKKVNEGDTQLYLAMVYKKLGRAGDAETSLKRLNVLRGGAAGDTELATIYAQWGNTAKALESLEKALPNREQDLRYLKVDPLLDPIRNEPRFQAVERELKFSD